MLSFESDYIKGAHEKILERLCEMNQDPQPGYGSDACCERAKEKIRKACGCPDADIFFLTGERRPTRLSSMGCCGLLRESSPQIPAM